VCLPSVVAEARAQLAAHGLLAGLALETLVPLAAAVASSTSRPSQRPLEMFFPFDPYLLKRSSRYLELQSSYVRWRKGGARVAGRVTGASESEGEEDIDVALPVDEDGDMLLDDESDSDSDSSDSSSSSETEDGSLRGASLPSAGMLSRPKLGSHPKSTMNGRPVPFRPPRPTSGLAWGSHKAGPHLLPPAHSHPYVEATCGRAATHMGNTFHDQVMGTSYSTGLHSSIGDGDRGHIMGTSPAGGGFAAGVVEYYSQSISPMQMSMGDRSVMETVPSKLAIAGHR